VLLGLLACSVLPTWLKEGTVYTVSWGLFPVPLEPVGQGVKWPGRKFTWGSNMVFWPQIFHCTKFGPLVLRKIIVCCHQMSYFKGWNAPNRPTISAGALPLTPLGELTVCPTLPSWIKYVLLLREEVEKEREGRGKRREGSGILIPQVKKLFPHAWLGATRHESSRLFSLGLSIIIVAARAIEYLTHSCPWSLKRGHLLWR